MHKELIGSIPQKSNLLSDYLLEGLRNKFTSPDYRFKIEFNSKSGDYDIVVEANFEIAPTMLSAFKNETQLK